MGRPKKEEKKIVGEVVVPESADKKESDVLAKKIASLQEEVAQLKSAKSKKDAGPSYVTKDHAEATELQRSNVPLKSVKNLGANPKINTIPRTLREYTFAISAEEVKKILG